MSKHTKGDWKLEKTMAGTVIVSHGYVVAEIVGISDIHYANANLIAAAPDMLEVLQMMADKDFEISDYECRLARMALAKARGD